MLLIRSVLKFKKIKKMDNEEESIEEKSFSASSLDDENFNDDLGNTLDPLEETENFGFGEDDADKEL